jgi:hypothetical protein
MSLTTLKLTEFQVEKLQCIGAGDRGNPYRISTYNGIKLGSVGTVAEAVLEAANQDSFEIRGLHSFKRLLKVFGM